ncbi:MAG TPA: hypothetical protein VJ481_01845 [Patescibacteria group bacterium]|uniref:Membrane protein 6-pyruvoyl-tetrahydropterin synthase-related domain-containing protein n=1 Tax=Candidatus Woesebacteria bacterium RBG_13_46_13 TaxID=1802479 RepID=A0A1F7X5F8_9BACT|nr:MAG: hypothetical protein A2Y68_01615 [Candidatus Woesebacteria bacterium RBG_13_46_13]HJX59281.1 hypothetical protein [Patescibacteria group bacterium]
MRKHLLAIILISLFSLLGLKALLAPGLYTAHDIWHQVARLYHYQRAVSEGVFPPYWISTLAGGFGYPLFVFSYHFPWLLALPILKIGFDIPATIKILFFISHIASGFAMYVLSLRVFKSRWAGLTSAILYLWAPFRFLTIIVAAAMGVAFVFTFIPILCLGILLAADEKKARWAVILIALGTAGIILSHFSSVLAVIPTAAIFSLAIFFTAKDRKAFVLNSLRGLLLGLGLSSFYVLPAIYYSKLGIGFGNNYLRYFVNLSQLVYSKWGYGPIINSAKDGEMSFQVGVAHWISIALSSVLLIFSKRGKTQRHIPLSLLIAFAFSLFMMLDYSLPVWETITHFVPVDFPFRFMLPAVFVASLLAGFVMISVGKLIKPILFIFLIVVALFTNRNHIRVNLYTDYQVEDYVAAEFTTSSMNEYLPLWVDTHLFSRKSTSPLEPENIPVKDIERATQKLSFEAIFPKEMSVSVNHLAYPGIILRVDGNPTNYSRDVYGRVSFSASKGKHNIAVTFEETKMIKIAKLVSLGSLIVLLGLIFTPPFLSKLSLRPR